MSIPTIRERAQAAKARAEKATPGPWVSPWDSDAPGEGDPPEKEALRSASGEPVVGLAYHDGWHLGGTREDFALIAAAREDIPALADFALRVTSDAMWERVRAYLDPELGAAADDAADAIMALLTSEAP